MLSVSVTEYDIADVRPLFGKAQDEPAARTVPGPMTSVRPVRPYIRPYDDQNKRDENRDHEAVEHHVRIRRRSDAGIGGPVIR